MKLGEKIKLVRKQRGMTQRELGERLHLDGNAANRIAQYESGFRTPKEGRIQEIARVLNVRKENFFTSAETQEDIIRLMIWYDWEHGCGGSVPIDTGCDKKDVTAFFLCCNAKKWRFRRPVFKVVFYKAVQPLHCGWAFLLPFFHSGAPALWKK